MKDVKFTNETDAVHFRTGERIVRGSGRESGGLSVVQSVDVANGVITLRDPTRWERIRWTLGRPLRWLRWKWLSWRHGG